MPHFWPKIGFLEVFSYRNEFFYLKKGNFLNKINNPGLWRLTGVEILKIRPKTADLWFFEKSKNLQYSAKKHIFGDFLLQKWIIIP